MADQLQEFPLVTPGYKGLNATQANVPDLDTGWATTCQNWIFDTSGRLAARNGWTQLTITPIAGLPNIAAQVEFATAAGTTFVVSAANHKLYSGTTTLTDITGSLTITGNNWQFVTFNGAVYGAQVGHPLIMWNGSGNFVTAPGSTSKTVTASITGNIMTVTATLTGNPLQQGDVVTGSGVPGNTYITQQLTYVATTGGSTGTYQLNQAATFASGTLTVATISPPTGGNCVLAAFGRLWVLGSDNQTINYCALLDATTWYANSLSFTGAGSINMANVWTRGIDAVQAIAAAGAKLVVFGAKQIVIYADSSGATIGLNPQNIYVYDTVEGTGCAARDTVQATGEGDLTFLSPTGVQSLQRLLSSGRDNPVAPLDPQIRDYFNSYFINETPNAVRSVYSPQNRFYLIFLPLAARAFVYDTRVKLPPDPTFGQQAGAMLRVTEWPALTWTAICNSISGAVYVGGAGVVGQYAGYLDNGATYSATYISPNFAMKPNFENRRKILKRMNTALYYGAATTVTMSWGVDFNGLSNSTQASFAGTLTEYGISQYNINEYGGGAGFVIYTIPLSLTGRFLQFGFSAPIAGALALQQLDIYFKVGNTV